MAECRLQQWSPREPTRLPHCLLQRHIWWWYLSIHPPLLSPPNPSPFTFLPLCCPALRSSYEEEEADLPNLEDLQGAAKGLMRLQDVYALQVSSLVRGRFQRVTNGESVDVYMPAVSVQLSGDDCFLVGKVLEKIMYFGKNTILHVKEQKYSENLSNKNNGAVLLCSFFYVWLPAQGLVMWWAMPCMFSSYA